MFLRIYNNETCYAVLNSVSFKYYLISDVSEITEPVGSQHKCG